MCNYGKRNRNRNLLLYIDLLYAAADGSENLVRNGVEGVGEDCYREVCAEDFYAVAFLAVDVGNIYHRYVHADIANVWRFLAVYETVAVATTEVAVESVGITDRNGCYARVSFQNAALAVANGVFLADITDLENCGHQRRDIVYDGVVAIVHAIESDAETAHIHLAVMEMENACGVVDVAKNLVREGTLENVAAMLELAELIGREVIEAVFVSTYEMREYGARCDGLL